MAVLRGGARGCAQVNAELLQDLVKWVRIADVVIRVRLGEKQADSLQAVTVYNQGSAVSRLNE
jgi:hypothetical protein